MTYKVKYTKVNSTEGTIIVRAKTEQEAIKNAKYLCFTGSNFREPLKINDCDYIKPRQQGFQGSERQNN